MSGRMDALKSQAAEEPLVRVTAGLGLGRFLSDPGSFLSQALGRLHRYLRWVAGGSAFRFWAGFSPGTRVNFRVSQVSWSGSSFGLPRRTTTLRSNCASVGAGGAGGPIRTGSFGLGMKTCIFESHVRSKRRWFNRLGRLSRLLVRSARDLDLGLAFLRCGLLARSRARHDARFPTSRITT